jgi:hypothetical protein
MKASFLIFSPLLLLASCKEKKTVVVVPVATEVAHDNSFRPDGTPRQEVKVVPPTAVPVPEEVPPAVEVDEEEPSPRTPGEHVDHAIQKTDEGLRKAADATGRFLQRAGDKIEDESRRQAPPPPPRE